MGAGADYGLSQVQSGDLVRDTYAKINRLGDEIAARRRGFIVPPGWTTAQQAVGTGAGTAFGNLALPATTRGGILHMHMLLAPAANTATYWYLTITDPQGRLIFTAIRTPVWNSAAANYNYAIANPALAGAQSALTFNIAASAAGSTARLALFMEGESTAAT